MGDSRGIGSRIFTGQPVDAFRQPVRLLNSISNLKPLGAVNIDGVTPLISGDRVLFTSLSGAEASDNNKVFRVVATAGNVTAWNLDVDGRNPAGAARDGDLIYIQEGTTNGDKLFKFTGSSWAEVAGGAAGANQFLSNLTAPTAVNQNLIPAGARDIGSVLSPWNNLIASFLTIGIDRFLVTSAEVTVKSPLVIERETTNNVAFIEINNDTNTAYVGQDNVGLLNILPGGFIIATAGAGEPLGLATSSVLRLRISDLEMRPAVNNAYALGTSSFIFSDVFATIHRVGLSGDVLSTTTPSGVSAVSLRSIAISTAAAIFSINNSTNDASATGDVLIESGNKTVGTGNSGSIVLMVGTATATQGNFRFIRSGTTTTIGFIWTASATDGSGYWAAAPAGGANTALSNLTNPTSINQNLLPSGAFARSIGSASLPFDGINAGSFNAFVTGSVFNGRMAGLNGIQNIDGSVFSSNLHLLIETGGASNFAPMLLRSGTINNTTESGRIFVSTGGNVSATGATGEIRLVTGDSSGSGNSGGVTLKTGTSSSGTRGAITLNTASIVVVGTSTAFGTVTNRIGTFYASTVRVVSSLNLTNSSDSARVQILADDTSPSGVSLAGAMKGQSSLPIAVYTDSGTTSPDVRLETGNASSGASGGFVLLVGTATTTQGNFRFIRSGTTTTIGFIWTASATDGTGYWAAASAPTGTANTVAFFNGGGALTSEANLAYTTSTKSLALFSIFTSGIVEATAAAAFANGFVASGGTIQATGRGSISRGVAFGATGQILSSDDGTHASGYANIGKILSENAGSFAHGVINNNSASRIRAATGGSFALGAADGGAILLASGTGSVAIGYTLGTGAALTSSNSGSHVFGLVDGSSPSEIVASALGSGARGQVQNGGIIRAITGAGSWASGRALAGSSLISASGVGSHAFGSTNTGGQITTSGNGSFSMGQAVNSGIITSSGAATMAFGYADTSGTISSTGTGSVVFGYTETASSFLRSIGAGSFTVGAAISAGVMTSTGNGAMARGIALGASVIISSEGGGSLASGSAQGGTLDAQGEGSHTLGFVGGASAILRSSGQGATCLGSVLGTSAFILASGEGSFAGGKTSVVADSVTASGIGSFAFGAAHNVSARYATAFGIGHTVSTFGSFVCGQYALALGTPGVPDSLEIAFAVGMGVSGTPANAFSVGQNGDLKIRRTITPALTTGDQTINRPSGTVNFAAGSVVINISNGLVNATSIVFAVVRTNDSTAIIKNVVASGGNIEIRLNAAATAETSVGFLVTN